MRDRGTSAMSQGSAACYPLAEDTEGLLLSINLDFGDHTIADFSIVLLKKLLHFMYCM